MGCSPLGSVCQSNVQFLGATWVYSPNWFTLCETQSHHGQQNESVISTWSHRYSSRCRQTPLKHDTISADAWTHQQQRNDSFLTMTWYCINEPTDNVTISVEWSPKHASMHNNSRVWKILDCKQNKAENFHQTKLTVKVEHFNGGNGVMYKIERAQCLQHTFTHALSTYDVVIIICVSGKQTQIN